MPLEILAPAGGEEQLIAAVRAGADAVYLGTKNFNARRNASNFDGDGLCRAVEYCHGRGVRVHVTCNTLVADSELEKVYDEMRLISRAGADAVIVQDLAVAAMFREYCPAMPLHASTQMTVHNEYGVNEAKRLGFSRVVLARELSLDEIARIAEKTDIELEAFVHGALCMSVSGQCWLSSILGGRSGNRGLCAQPCRLNFISPEREYALSLKDASAIERIYELERAGVCSLKIEGRMKRPEYVAAATAACRAVLRGEKPDMDTLRAVFSRSGFTDGYISGKRGADMFGVRRREDVMASSAVLGGLAALYRAERQSVPVSIRAELRADKPMTLTVSDGEISVSVSGDVPQKAQKRSTEEAEVIKNLEKTGGTPFYVNHTKLGLDGGLYVSASSINTLRREALEKLLAERSKTDQKPVIGEYTPIKAQKRRVKSALRLRFERAAQIFDTADEAERIYLPLGEINGDIISRFKDKLIAELGRFTAPGECEKIKLRLAELKELGLKNACASTIGDIAMIREAGLKIFGGFTLNVLNSLAVKELKRLGVSDTLLSFECSMGASAYISGESIGLVGYGYLPLMLLRCCPMRGKNGCGSCNGAGKIKDRRGAEFTVLCSGKKYSSLLNSVPLYIGDKAADTVDYMLLYYTVESAARCREVYEKFKSGAELGGERTRGLYYRELL